MKREMMRELKSGENVDATVDKYASRGLSNEKILQVLKKYERRCFKRIVKGLKNEN